MSVKMPRGAVEPQQARSWATLARLLDATEELLRDRAWDEMTIQEIVAKAGSSVGAFYSRFQSKEDLLVALLERYHEDSVTALKAILDEPGWSDLGLQERVSRFVARVAATCRQRRGLLRLRNQRRLGADEVTGGESERDRAVVQGFCKLFDGCRDEIRHPDSDAALLFALRTIDAVMVAAIAFDDISSSFEHVEPEALETSLTSMVTGWLCGAPSSHSERS